MKRIIKILVVFLLTIVSFVPYVSAEEITSDKSEKLTMNDVSMQCTYTGGIMIMYDVDNGIYLSDSASESDSANSSIPISNKYLLGSTKYLKEIVYNNSLAGGNLVSKGFYCPKYLQVASVLNLNPDNSDDSSGDNGENKSYSNYYFAINSNKNLSEGIKDDPAPANKWVIEKYIIYFSAEKLSKYYAGVKIESDSVKMGDYTYSGQLNDNFRKKALDYNKWATETDKYMTLEDIYGVGYATKGVTKKNGWWFFGTQEAGTYSKSIISMIESTKINEIKSLINEKVFITNDKTSSIECNYITSAEQTIGAKLFVTASIFKNGNILIEGNEGSSTGNDTTNRTTFSSAITKAMASTTHSVNTSVCPSTTITDSNGESSKVVYVKIPTQKIEYGKTNPSVSYENVRYEITTTTPSGEYVTMTLLPEGESLLKDEGKDVCAEFLPQTTIVLKEIIAYMTIFIPVIVIVLILIDYIKVIKANADNFDDANKKQLKRLKTRLALIAFFLLLRPLINIVLNILYVNGVIEVSNIDCLFF